jgi:hypothetical protein
MKPLQCLCTLSKEIIFPEKQWHTLYLFTLRHNYIGVIFTQYWCVAALKEPSYTNLQKKLRNE